MTIVAALWPRAFPGLPPAEDLLIEVEPASRVLVRCHWQPDRKQHPALVLVHGLDGSSESSYILGSAEKAFRAGFHVLRMNQRNCGGTEALTPTLYHSGLSEDVRIVAEHAVRHAGVAELFAAGFSMGGNLVLKMAGEMGLSPPEAFAGVVAVNPSLDLAACADSIAEPRNWVYEARFLRGLKRRLRRKAELFPERYRLDGLVQVATLREFDDHFTAPLSGFENADDYYFRASALRVVEHISVPSLILTAQDDPFIPYRIFRNPAIEENPWITVEAPPCGGHCGFLSRWGGEERFWSEARLVEFCRARSLTLQNPSQNS